jgi:leader peptidase (prepilin peptidase)/N-methyltransferase
MISVGVLILTAVITTMTDLDWRLIPDEATALLAVTGVVTSIGNPWLGGEFGARFAGSILGLIVGGGVVWLIGRVGTWAFGKDAMGGGDVKLLGAIGSVVGWQSALIVLFLAALVGGMVAIVGLASGRLRRHQYVPFGPFLNLAAISVALVLGPQLKLIDILGLNGRV